MLIDASELAQVEHDYGSQAFEQVLSLVSGLVASCRAPRCAPPTCWRSNERGGNAFLLFLSPRRGEEDGRPRIADLEAICQRVGDQLNRKLAGFSSPYLRGKRKVTVGYAVVFHNPLIMAERVVARLVSEAWESVRIQKMQADFQTRCRLQDVLLGQPDHDRLPADRGPAARAASTASRPSRAARRDPAAQPGQPLRGRDGHRPRLRARPALPAARAADRARPARAAPLFINVVPASMYDPDFQGRASSASSRGWASRRSGSCSR